MFEVEGLPEGWRAVAYRVPKGNIEFVFIENVVREAKPQDKKCLIVEKIQPRRIVLEETREERSVSYGEWFEYDGLISQWPNEEYGSTISYKVWREVKETDEPKLSLSVAECKRIVNCTAPDVVSRILEFIKDK